VAADRRTLGDLCAQILRMVGQSDTTFGEVGTLGGPSNSLFTDTGLANSVKASTNLHKGSIDP
jgi:hypothetical protein